MSTAKMNHLEYSVGPKHVENIDNVSHGSHGSHESHETLQPSTSHSDHIKVIEQIPTHPHAIDYQLNEKNPPRVSRQETVLREHGPAIDHKIFQEEAIPQRPDLWWSRVREFMKDPFSEFFGTFILLLFGDGVVAQVVLSNGTKGSYQSITWGWGLGVMLGVYVGGKSGGHLNPAVTFANCLYRKCPWRKLPIYAFAQILGAFCASGVVYANYKSAFDQFEGGPGIRTVTGPNATAGVFCTYPAAFMTKTGMFFSEFIASTILMFTIYACADDGNIGAGNLMPLALFFIIFGIGACFGWETGYAINLARDFGPRLMSYFLGYGHEVWSAGDYYFWIPMVAPFFGCTFGGFLYDVFIFTGDSPINTPWMGLRRLMPGYWNRKTWSNTYKERASLPV